MNMSDGPTTYWTDPHQALIHQIAVNRDTFLAKQILAERDRARDIACALEAENARLLDDIRGVWAMASVESGLLRVGVQKLLDDLRSQGDRIHRPFGSTVLTTPRQDAINRLEALLGPREGTR
jgi:hypothetical protein